MCDGIELTFLLHSDSSFASAVQSIKSSFVSLSPPSHPKLPLLPRESVGISNYLFWPLIPSRVTYAKILKVDLTDHSKSKRKRFFFFFLNSKAFGDLFEVKNFKSKKTVNVSSGRKRPFFFFFFSSMSLVTNTYLNAFKKKKGEPVIIYYSGSVFFSFFWFHSLNYA